MSTHSKLDHALRHVVHQLAAIGPDKDSRSRAADRSDLVARFFHSPALAKHVTRDNKLDVVIRSCDPARTGKHIEKLGGHAHVVASSRIVTARVPFERLLEVADDVSVLRMELSHEHESLLDLANVSTGLTGDGGERPFSGLLGEGVLVGIVDTGIDVMHPAFAELDTGTRIVAYWDQETGQKYGEGFKSITDAAKDAPDTNGHGTAVAATAAGNGRGSPDGVMVGVAPRAKIAMVKTTFATADIIDGMNWLCERADKLGLPLVINLSLGSQADGHDGLDLMSQRIDELSGKGRIVAVAAGNEGSDEIHAMHEFKDDAPVWGFEFQPRLVPVAGEPGKYSGRITVTIWGSRHDRLELVLEDPRGLAHAAPGNVGDHEDVSSAGYTGYWDKDRQAVTGDAFYTLSLDIASADVHMRGPWTIHAKRKHGASGSETVHAWITNERHGYISTGASPGYKIGRPASARAAVTAGSYVTRNQWVTSTGRLYRADGLVVGRASAFSSPGPTRDQRLKPDLSAPGEYVATARSSRSAPDPLYQIGQSAYFVTRGTSFASPYVAGAIALLLQLDPAMTPEAAKLLLQGTVDPRVPATQWGAGRIDCKRLLQEATRLLRPPQRLASGE